MKQKRKEKNLLQRKTQRSNKLSILLFTVSGMLCMFAMLLFSSSKVSFAAPTSLQYTGVNDKTQVVYEVTLMDPIDYSTDVHSMYVTGGSVYVTPKPVIVNRTLGGTNTQDPSNWDSTSNKVLSSVYGNILGGELNTISSDNVTIIAGASNEVNAGNENATILGGEGNRMLGTSGKRAVMVGGEGNKIHSSNEGVSIVGGNTNTVSDTATNSVVLGGEGNTVNANNAIVGGKNVEGNAENAFVYSSDGSYYEANAGGTFYLGVENGLGINTDGNTKGLSVEGSLGEGEINVNDSAQKCNTNNIGMQGMYQGCLVGCTSKSAAVGKWEMMDQGEECRKKEEGREQSNENIMQSPKLQEEKLLEDLPAGKCSIGIVYTGNATLCEDPANYKGMIFETTLVDHGKCPGSSDKLKNNKCVYACNVGYHLTGDVTHANWLGSDRYDKMGCFKDCVLDEGSDKVTKKHNETVYGYRSNQKYCSNDANSPASFQTCANYENKKLLICVDGTFYVKEKYTGLNGTSYAENAYKAGLQTNTAVAQGYVKSTCNLGGYDCKTDASNYFIPENTLKSSTWEGRILNAASAWGDDRKQAAGTKGTYELCISYNAAGNENCTKKTFNYKLKYCNPKYYWKSDSEGCQLCEAGYYCPGEAGKSPRYEVSNGYYAIAGQDHQTQCPAGYRDGTVHANKVSEASCLRNMPAGYYMASGKSTSNTECANGYYKTAHTVTYGGTTSCTICPAGYRNGTSVDNKKAENVCLKNVAAGYYVGSAHAAETVCANGYYRIAHTVTYGATSSCTICPAGYRNGTALANKTAENVCLKNVACGKYVPTAKGAETNCPAGYFRADAHNVTYGATSSCTKASAGSYVGSAGLCAQTACGGGKWSAAGASACSNINAGCYGTSATKACPAACGAGKWSAAGSASCSNISCGCYGTSGGNSCPAKCAAATSSAAGSYSSAGVSSCTTESRNGYYVASAGACGPSACPAGYYCPSGKIIQCPAGTVGNGTTTASSKSAACKTCPAGYYCRGGTDQQGCGVGRTSSEGGTAFSSCYCSPSYTSYLGSCPTGGNCSSYTSYEGTNCSATTRYVLNSCNAASSSYPLSSCPTGGNCSSTTGYSKSGNSCNAYTRYKLNSCNAASSSYPLTSCPTGGSCSSTTGYTKSGNSCNSYKRYKLNSCSAASSSYPLSSCPTGGNCSSTTGYTKSGNSCNAYTRYKLNSCNAASSSYTLTSCPSNCNCSSTTGYTKSGNSCNSYTRYKIDSAKSGYKVSGNSCILDCTTTAKSASSSAVAYSNRSSCSYGYDDPDTCGSDNSCDCNGNTTRDGVICNSRPSCSANYYRDGSSCIGPCSTDGLLWHTHGKYYSCKECDSSHPCSSGKTCTSQGECVQG